MKKQSHILITDDEINLANSLSFILEAAAYQVSIAGHGNEALQKILAAERQSAVDLLITDVRMPDLNGIQLVEKLREQDAIRPYAEKFLAGENAVVDIDGDTFELTPDEVEVKVTTEVPVGAVEDSGYVVVLDTELTDDLLREGMAREVVRRIQTMRKSADFNLNDRIAVVYSGSERLTQAIEQFSDYISQETLADTLTSGDVTDDFYQEDLDFKGDLEGESLSVGVKQLS